MTTKEIELILIEGLCQTPETVVDFYLSKAKENNCSPANFCQALYEGYKRLDQHVNSYLPNEWGENEDGQKEPLKKTINLLYYTEGRYIGHLDCENIIFLLPGLQKFIKHIQTELKNEASKKSKVKPIKIEPTFKGLFRDVNNASAVKKRFELKGYTVNGVWQGLTKDKTELLAAYYVLRPLLKPGKITSQARIFYQEFGLGEDYITERSLRNEPFNDSRNEFESIFFDLLKPISKN